MSGCWPGWLLDGTVAGPLVVVTVAETRGSTPRESGARMAVSATACHGSIGGGNLEFKAVEMARAMLQGQAAGACPPPATLRRFPLGPALGQCCGGVVTLLFEHVAAPRPSWVEWADAHLRRGTAVCAATVADGPRGGARLLIAGASSWDDLDDAALSASLRERLDGGAATGIHWFGDADGRRPVLIELWPPAGLHVVLFGAGHVGRALATVLGELPCTVHWVDERPQAFPPRVPGNVTTMVSRAYEVVIDAAPAGTCFVVMTHSHAIDEAICEHILGRGDFRYCGLIGSRAKRRRFEKRMAARGLPATALARLTCPIGIDGLEGKHPGTIAVAVAAELLVVAGAATAADGEHHGRAATVPKNDN